MSRKIAIIFALAVALLCGCAIPAAIAATPAVTQLHQCTYTAGNCVIRYPGTGEEVRNRVYTSGGFMTVATRSDPPQFTVTKNTSAFSYPSIDYGGNVNGFKPTTGATLPRPLSELHHVRVTVHTVYQTAGQRSNDASDIWLTRPDGKPAAEVMLWLGWEGSFTPCDRDRVAHVRLGNVGWELCRAATRNSVGARYIQLRRLGARKYSMTGFDVMTVIGWLERKGYILHRDVLNSVDWGFETWGRGVGNRVTELTVKTS